MHPETAETTIRLLGDLGAWVGGNDARPRGRKACAMLGIIAASSAQSIRREELADLLWSDRGEEQARSSLRQAIGELRNGALGSHGAVAIGRDDIGFVAGRVSIDIGEILAACDRHDVAQLAGCLAEVGGVFMAGYDGLAPGFDDWLRVERPRHHQRIIAAVLEQAPAMLTGARIGSVQGILRALDRLDPLNEVVARFGMEADHAAGDGASLHRRYRTLCEELEREFESKPAPETRALFHRLTAEATAEPIAPNAVVAEPVPHARNPPMVLVSPIVATDGNEDSAEMAAAATDDIRVALARHADVRVIALDTLDLERVESVCSTAIAAYMLSGRVRRTADGTRINLQLGNIASSIVVWSEQLRLDRGTMDEAIDRIVMKAVGAVVPAIDRDYADRSRLEPATHADAAALYARGRYQIRSVKTLAAVREGVALLDEAIALDPGHVGARLLLAQAYNTDFWQQIAGHDVAEFRQRALTLVQEAAALEPGNMRIQVKLAWCYLRRGEWTAAERRLRTAIDASPYDAEAMDECALAFAQLGDVDLAIELMQRAFSLNPFPPADYHADYAIMMAMQGDVAASEEHFEASGETRLQYIAARLSNLARLPQAAAQRALLRGEFLERFAQGWQGDREAGLDDMLAWFEQTYVFRTDAHRAFWRDGFSAALA